MLKYKGLEWENVVVSYFGHFLNKIEGEVCGKTLE